MNRSVYILLLFIAIGVHCNLSAQEIMIQSSKPNDQEWKVIYHEPEGYLSSGELTKIIDAYLDQAPNTQPTAIFVYKSYSSVVETNRKKTITYGSIDFSEEIEEEDIHAYPEFLRIHCRIPVSTEFILEKEGRLPGTYQSRIEKVIDCEKKLIAETWKGNGSIFWLHKHYHQIPDVTKFEKIPDFLLYIGTVLGFSFMILLLLFVFLYFLYKNSKLVIYNKSLSILGCVGSGIFIFLLSTFVFGQNEPEPPGVQNYFLTLSLLSGAYNILCFIPFWGLTNYLLVGDRSFKLWLILLGFILAPLLLLAAGGLKGSSRSSSTTTRNESSSGGSSSTPVTGRGGTFGGGGSSGQW
ncbi:hypothetical protein [Leptospira sp. GIMC2001]|uniref:hypothetical protein n=1 Tax=Leptospira sp. GIMC2001 TaxID=1513297 RepID=UPI00234B9A61|nr:hypothetical protein [Leptospira sp. GIMC2001]WCL47731.1 hypothetical protein O4O04_00305 [Leptospira sp. GIMC2001]